MNRLFVWLGAAVAIYFATGLFVVRGNEQALVRRFGKVQLPAVVSGLHYDLPWPLTQIDRVNLNQLRTVSIGLQTNAVLNSSATPTTEGTSNPGSFLREVNVDRQAEFLTGDKNILHLQINVQYQVTDPAAYLFSNTAPETALRLLAESLVTETVSRCGVDFVHPLGLNELRETLTRQMRTEADAQPWGIAVEDVTIGSVLPPVEVKAAFLDVSNARAERDRLIHEEQTRAEQLLSNAHALASQKTDRAKADQQKRVEAARGSADRFNKIIAQFRHEAETGKVPYAEVRRMTLERMYVALIEEVLPKLAGKVLLNTQKPVDLTIFPQGGQPESRPSAEEKK